MTTPDPARAGTRQWLALVVLTLAVVLLAVDGTVLSLAVPALTAALRPTATQLLWIGDVYSFVLAGLLITMGNLADRIGRKRLLLIGAAGFGVASALAAFAPSAEVLIAARALLGLFGATLMPSTLSIIRNMFTDPAQRIRAIAIWSAGATAGAAMGPMVGGVLLEHFWWGAVFLINVPVMVVLIGAGVLLLPESRNHRAGPIDLLSAALSIAAIIPVVYAIKQLVASGPSLFAAVGVLTGVVSGAWFVRRQRRLLQPLVDVALFRVPAFSGAVLANAIAIFALSGLLFFYSQYLQLVRGFRPVVAGLAELPLTLAAIAVVFVIGAIARRLGAGRAIGTGLLVAATGLVLLAGAEAAPSYVWMALALVPIGLGVGLASALSTDAVVAAVPRERAGAAASVAETAYELGTALGIALLGSLHTLMYRAHLDVPNDLPASLRDAVTDSLANASRVLPGTQFADLLTHAQQAFTTAMQLTSLAAAFLVAAAAVLAWRHIPSAGPARRPAGTPSPSGEGTQPAATVA